MTVRSRLSRLGGDGRPRIECARCAGTGGIPRHCPGDDQSDSPHAAWLINQRVHRVRVQLAEQHGEPPPPPFDEPEPQPIGPPARCPQCWGRGEMTEAEVASAHLAAEQNWIWFGDKMRRMVEAMAGQRIVDRGEPVESTPTLPSSSESNNSPSLHAVTSDDAPPRY